MNFEDLFRSKKLKNTEFITEEMLRYILAFELEIPENEEMNQFIDYLVELSEN